MSRYTRVVLIAGATAALAGGVAWLSPERARAPVGLPTVAPARAPDAVAAPAPVPPPTAAPAPAAPLKIRYPIAASNDRSSLPALAESDAYAESALNKLLGRKSVLTFLALDGFVRNFVATVDYLATRRAPTLAWPVKTTPRRFMIEGTGAHVIVAAENANRYAAFVAMARSVDSRRAVALYKRMYPLFQQAWENLGPAGTYFNDRVVEVIDHLLATPDVSGPIKLRRAEVQGRPRGALYVFQDPALEARSAGQKMLLRMGKENADALKAKLGEVRALITKARRSGR